MPTKYDYIKRQTSKYQKSIEYGVFWFGCFDIGSIQLFTIPT